MDKLSIEGDPHGPDYPLPLPGIARDSCPGPGERMPVSAHLFRVCPDRDPQAWPL